MKGIGVKIESSGQGIWILERHLSYYHAIIIVEDVDNAELLDMLLPIKNILSPKSSGLLGSSIYNLVGLNTLHSKELFCLYTFIDKLLPPPEFEDGVGLFVKACDGLPSSLKILGAVIYGGNDKN